VERERWCAGEVCGLLGYESAPSSPSFFSFAHVTHSSKTHGPAERKKKSDEHERMKGREGGRETEKERTRTGAVFVVVGKIDVDRFTELEQTCPLVHIQALVGVLLL
jgi:hypothetical protein